MGAGRRKGFPPPPSSRPSSCEAFWREKVVFAFFSLLLFFKPQRWASFSEARALFGLLKVFDSLKSLKVFFLIIFLFKKLLTTIFI